MTQNILPEMKQEMLGAMDEIRAHFFKLHSALQTRYVKWYDVWKWQNKGEGHQETCQSINYHHETYK